MTIYRYQVFPSKLTHGSLSEASSASVRGMDRETQFFRHPWPSPLGPDLVSAASQVSFPVLFCCNSGASEPGLSQRTHFSFAAETGGWSFLSPSPGIGSDCALRRSSREWDYIVGILI